MTPYGGRSLDEKQIIFNQELSRGRTMIENCFGILSVRWQCFLKKICCHPKNVDNIVLCAVLLHNFIISNNHQRYLPPNYTDRYEENQRVDGNWRQETQGGNITPIQRRAGIGARNATDTCIQLRDSIKDLLYSHIHQ